MFLKNFKAEVEKINKSHKKQKNPDQPDPNLQFILSTQNPDQIKDFITPHLTLMQQDQICHFLKETPIIGSEFLRNLLTGLIQNNYYFIKNKYDISIPLSLVPLMPNGCNQHADIFAEVLRQPFLKSNTELFNKEIAWLDANFDEMSTGLPPHICSAYLYEIDPQLGLHYMKNLPKYFEYHLYSQEFVSDDIFFYQAKNSQTTHEKFLASIYQAALELPQTEKIKTIEHIAHQKYSRSKKPELFSKNTSFYLFHLLDKQIPIKQIVFDTQRVSGGYHFKLDNPELILSTFQKSTILQNVSHKNLPEKNNKKQTL